MKINKDLVDTMTKTWSAKERERIFSRFGKNNFIDVLDIYKLFNTSHLSEMMRMIGRDDINKYVYNKFKNDFREPENLSDLHEVYHNMHNKYFKEALRVL